MTQSTVVRRERVAVRNDRGRIERVFETEWNEPADVAKKHAAELQAVATQQDRDLADELRAVRGERDHGRAAISQLTARVTELETQLITTRAAHEAERKATADAIAAAIEQRIERDAAETPKLAAALAELAELARAAAPPAPYTLPADLANLAGLAELERELLEIEHVRDPEQAARDHVTWVLSEVA